MRTLLAALPIVLLLALLLGTRASAAKAAWTALAMALVLAVSAFGFDASPHPMHARDLTGVAAEGAFMAGTILWILFPALAIHELQTRTGALMVLRDALAGAAPDVAGRALLIGWFFALFLEGAAGFGTPLAIAAPMLVALGLAPVPAVATALLGHTAGVAFGAVGTPVLAQAELTNVPVGDITRQTALLILPLAWIPAFFVLRAAQQDAAGPVPWPQGVLAVVSFCVPFALVAMWMGPELPTLAGALVGGLTFLARLRRDRASSDLARLQLARLLRAAAPYLAVAALIVLTRLVAPIKRIATGVSLDWELHGVFSGAMLPLYHPGTLLIGALVIGGWLQGAQLSDLARSSLAAVKRLAPAVMALIAMLTLSRLMLHSGMIAELAHAAARGVGSLWPAVAPAVGALGSFVTGSATASNILFTSLQDRTAANLDLPAVTVLAAQTAGASIGNAICPHNIVAGAAAVGAGGREGEIMRRTLPACALMLLLAGLLSLALSWMPLPHPG